jgi:hypothetical protein
MKYIQRKDLCTGQLETVDQFDSLSEAVRCLKEYRMADYGGRYYLSSRPCHNWTE